MTSHNKCTYLNCLCSCITTQLYPFTLLNTNGLFLLHSKFILAHNMKIQPYIYQLLPSPVQNYRLGFAGESLLQFIWIHGPIRWIKANINLAFFLNHEKIIALSISLHTHTHKKKQKKMRSVTKSAYRDSSSKPNTSVVSFIRWIEDYNLITVINN